MNPTVRPSGDLAYPLHVEWMSNGWSCEHLRAGDLTSDGRLLGGVLVAFFAVAVLAAADVVSDLGAGTTLGHVLAEGGVILVGLLGSVVVARRLLLTFRKGRKAEQEVRILAERLQATEAEASRWRAEARDLLDGLGNALDQQFERWALSPAEKEVALLLLKGLSHKEIAEVRSITEATARQQGRAVYKKAGLSGRNDLAAFFLEDLLLPGGSERSPRPSL
jgi:DNA-binding CsgD family transcriptional regulator